MFFYSFNYIIFKIMDSEQYTKRLKDQKSIVVLLYHVISNGIQTYTYPMAIPFFIHGDLKWRLYDFMSRMEHS